MNIKKYAELKSEKNFLKLICANVINDFGDSIDFVAFTILMYEITGSASMLALIAGLNFVPNILLTSFAGVLVDKWNKRLVMVICDLGRGLNTLITIGLYLSGSLNPFFLIMITLINSSFEAFRDPASVALKPHILAKEKYTLGFGLNTSLVQISTILGIALAAPLISIIGITGVIFIDTLTFISSALIIYSLKYQEQLVDTKFDYHSLMTSYKEGFKAVLSSKTIIFLAILGIVLNVGSIAFNTFQVIYISDYLKLDFIIIGIINIALISGMSLGSILIPLVNDKLSKATIIFIYALLITSNYLTLALLPMFKLSPSITTLCLIISFIIMGIGVGFMNNLFSVSFVSCVPQDLLARVSGIFNTILLLFLPITNFILAFLANYLSLTNIFLFNAISLFVLCTFLSLQARKHLVTIEAIN